MTRFHRETVTCPHCLNEEEVVIWDVIDVNEDPDLEEKLLLKELQNYECQNCNHLYILERPLLYLDRSNQAAYYFAPAIQDITDAVREDGRLDPALAAELPLDFGLDLSTYTLRLVSTYNDLIEKVHLLLDGYSDRLMEVVKLAVKTRLAEENIAEVSKQTELDDEAKAAALSSGATTEVLYLGNQVDEDQHLQLLLQTYSVANGWQQLELAAQVYDNTAALLLTSLPAEDRWDIVDSRTAEAMVASAQT